jgi:hypothetical protein
VISKKIEYDAGNAAINAAQRFRDNSYATLGLIVREISNSLNSVVPPFSADGIGSPRLNIQVT